jgi:hypothetical protein
LDVALGMMLHEVAGWAVVWVGVVQVAQVLFLIWVEVEAHKSRSYVFVAVDGWFELLWEPTSLLKV